MLKERRTDSQLIQTVTEATFESLVLKSTGPVAVEFMSYGCAHCRAIEPVLRQVAETIQSTEHIFRVNAAVDQTLAGRYDIQGTPTFVMFRNAREVGRVEGPHPTVAAVLAAVTQPFES
jgi:thioredoxin 1